MTTPNEIVAKVEQGGTFYEQVEEGTQFGRDVAALLRERGWKAYSSLSACKVATFETHLKKGARKIEIVSSFFLGPFTEVHVF